MNQMDRSTDGGRRAPTSTWCPLETLRETVRLSLSARRSSTTRLFPVNNASTRRKSTSEPHETPNIKATVRERGDVPFHVRLMIENGYVYSFFLPDKSLRYWSLTSTRPRGGTEGTDMAKTTTPSTAQNTPLRPRLSSVNNASTRRKPTSGPHETPNITATVREREWCPPFIYAS